MRQDFYYILMKKRVDIIIIFVNSQRLLQYWELENTVQHAD